jgi:tRNA-dihydrouridine synthase 3
MAMASTEATKSGRGDDPHSLKVKPEYVLSARADSLGPIPVVDMPEGPGDDRDNDSNNGDRRGKKKRRSRGQNKKRPRDSRQDDSEKLCLKIIGGETACPYGEDCRFSHDLKGYMATRPTDIVELTEAMGGSCPNYKSMGYCIYGAMCRVGSCHINKTGDNLRNEKDTSSGEEKDVSSSSDVDTSPLSGNDTSNILPRDVQFQLRKNKYPFQCKRHFEVREKKVKDDCSEKKVEMSTKDITAATSTSDAIDSSETKNSPTIQDITAATSASDAIDSSETKNSPTVQTTSPATSSFTPLDKLKTKKIVDFSNKVYVAPLTTVGNLPFRRIMKQFGADITCGEMALSTNLLEGKASEWALLKRHPSEDIFGVQLAAAHPDQFTRVSELVEKYTDVDFVDMNLGCPLDLLCNKGAGAALMMRERKLKGALEGMSNNLSCSITVKMRTGWNIHKPFAHELVPKIQSWNIDGLSAIMVSTENRATR